jgi:hypothetical protein
VGDDRLPGGRLESDEGRSARSVGLKDRLKRLEKTAGGGECPRCSGTVVIYVNDELESVTKDGRKFTSEEAEAFASDGGNGRCPACGASRHEITLGGPVENLSE